MADPKPPSDDELDELARKFHEGEGAPVAAPAAPAPAAAAPEAIDLDDAELRPEELRSTALARRLTKRRGYAFRASEPKTRQLLSSWGVAGVMILSAWAVYGEVPELRYWLSRDPPINLGHLGGYTLEQAHEGAFVHIEGIASPKRASYSRMFSEHELFPLIASRVLVDRAQAPDESMRGFGFRYSGEGRLVRAEEGGKWDAVRRQFVEANELARSGDIWVLEDGVSPHRGWRLPLEAGAWAAACLGSAAVLLARLRRRLQGKPAPAEIGE